MRGALRLGLALTTSVVALALATSAFGAAATGTLRLEPASVQVENGGTFSLKVMSNSSVAISGVSVTIKFDKALLQVQSITRGASWASAPLFLAGDAKAITTANQKGVLQGVASSFFPPNTIAAGDQEFITVAFKAIACGTATLTLPPGDQVDSAMLDGRDATYGTAMKITTTGATVTICQGGGGVSGSLAPDASGLPGETSDPGAVGATPAPGESTGGAGVGGPIATAGSSMQPASVVGGAGTDPQSWMTFAMGSLAVAAAGLAALILILVGVAIVGAAGGGVYLVRYWRRSAIAARAAAPAPVAVTVHDMPALADSGVTAAVTPESTPVEADPAGVPESLTQILSPMPASEQQLTAGNA